jgi:hypothetical protein
VGFVGFASFVLYGTPFWLGLRDFIMALFWLGLFFGGAIAINWYRFNHFMKDRLREFFNSGSGIGVQGELNVSR